ncbi:murein biosynthesis integral membrane protein MurJ [Kineococcus gynurae]|uniref:Murein biosynthesis integral membrane protein MurJ n=1 Tax=Kineococcus gynurae TaxID=452979 RepID=A0ABV5LT04_9ACTN
MSAQSDPATASSPGTGDAALARSSALMASGTLVSRLLGFVRTALQVTAIGGAAQVGAQVFDIANKAPNIFYMLLAGGVLNAVLVPQIVRAFGRPDGGKEYVDRLVTLALLIMGAATVVITLAAPLVVRLYTQSWPPEWLALATAMAFLCLPQVFFYGLYTVLGQVLNARSSFGPYMWAPVLNNVVAIAGLVAVLVLVPDAKQLDATEWTSGQIALLAGTSTLGVALQALILLWPLHRAGFGYRPRFGFRGMGFRTAGRLAGWTFAGVVAGQLVFLLTSKVMTRAGEALAGTTTTGAEGASSASYTAAYLLFMLPHSLVAVSLVTALFTRLSRNAGLGEVAAVRRDFSAGARTVLVAALLSSAALLALGPAIADALFGEPAIGPVVVAMAVGLAPFSLTYLAQRVFYAFEDARTPFVTAVVVAGVMLLADVALLLFAPPEWTVAGVGAAMSLSNLVGGVLSLALLRRRLRSLDGHGIDGYRLLRTTVRATIIALLAGGAGYGVVRLLEPLGEGRAAAVVTMLAGGVVVLAVFLVLCRVMRVRELTDLASPLLRRVPGLRGR